VILFLEKEKYLGDEKGLNYSRIRKIFSYIIISIITSVIFIPISVSGSPEFINDDYITQDAWFDADWQYRWKFSIRWYRRPPLFDYQAVLNIPHIFDYDLVKENGDDIRITSIDNVELPFWIERWNPGGYSRIYVRVPELIDSEISENYFYLYAGNENANSSSSGKDTFIYFDDFEDQVIGSQPTGWNISQTGYGNLLTSSESRTGDKSLYYIDNSTEGSPVIFRDLEMDITGYIFEYYVKLDYPVRSGGLAYTQKNHTFKGGNALFGHNITNFVYYYDGSVYQPFCYTFFASEWLRLSVFVQDGSFYDQNIFRAWSQMIAWGSDMEIFGTVSSINYLQFWQYPTYICSMYIDCLRVRKQNMVRHQLPSTLLGFEEIEEVFPPESTIVGYSIYSQILIISVIIFFVNKIKINKRRKK